MKYNRERDNNYYVLLYRIICRFLCFNKRVNLANICRWRVNTLHKRYYEAKFSPTFRLHDVLLAANFLASLSCLCRSLHDVLALRPIYVGNVQPTYNFAGVLVKPLMYITPARSLPNPVCSCIPCASLYTEVNAHLRSGRYRSSVINCNGEK